jgi:hypothetical protein
LKKLIVLAGFWLIFLLPGAILAENVYPLKYLYQTTEVKYKTDLSVNVKVTPITSVGSMKNKKFTAAMKLKMESTDLRTETSPEGDLTINTTIESTAIDFSYLGKKIKYNQENGDILAKKTIVTRIDSCGNVLNVDSPALPELKKEEKSGLNLAGNNVNFQTLPGQSVRIGESWTTTTKVPLNQKVFAGGDNFSFPVTYTLIKVKKIKGKLCGVIKAAASNVLPSTPIKKKAASDSNGTGNSNDSLSLLLSLKGEYIFNIEDGCTESCRIEIKGNGFMSRDTKKPESALDSMDMKFDLVAKLQMNRVN